MSNSTDFLSMQNSFSDTNKYPHQGYHTSDKENCNVHQPKPTQRVPFQSKTIGGTLTERLEEILSQSTFDSSLDSIELSKLDDVLSSPTLFQQIESKECQHINVLTQRCSFCKDCGVFLPKSGSKVYRDSAHDGKLNISPDEIYAVMVETQHKNREYHPNAPHLPIRKTMTDWIFQVSQDLKVSPDTTCAIISYVDTMLCKVEVSKENLQLVILSCLILATKFLETDDKVPPLREAYNLCQGIYSIDLFKKAEGLILENLNWDLRVVSPYQYIHFYLSKGCVFSNDETLFDSVDAEILGYLKKYSECFVNLSMDDYEFNQFASNIVACAAIASTRKLIGITPLWNVELEELTSTSWEMIEPCFNKLYSFFESSFPEMLNFSKLLVERRESQKEQKSSSHSYETLSPMIVEAKETPIKKQCFKITRNADSGKKKDLPAHKKELRKKAISRFGKARNTENKSDENESNNKMSVEGSTEFFDNNEKSGNIKRNLIY